MTLHKNLYTVIQGNKIYSINGNEPLINVYNSDSEKLEISFNLSTVEMLNSRLNFVEEEFQKSKDSSVSYILFEDALIENDNLYLLYMSNDGEKVSSNKILHIKITENNTFEVMNNFLLDRNGWFETFTIFDNQLLTFDRTSSTLPVYEINGI